MLGDLLKVDSGLFRVIVLEGLEEGQTCSVCKPSVSCSIVSEAISVHDFPTSFRIDFGKVFQGHIVESIVIALSAENHVKLKELCFTIPNLPCESGD